MRGRLLNLSRDSGSVSRTAFVCICLGLFSLLKQEKENSFSWQKALQERSMLGKEPLRKVKGSVFDLMLEVLLMKQMSKKEYNLNYGKLGISWGAQKGGKQRQKIVWGFSICPIWSITRSELR